MAARESTDGGGFRLPPDVTCEHKQFPHGPGYEFRHARLGQLGRLVLMDVGGQCHISSEVSGVPEDPMTRRRQEILEPITLELTRMLTGRFGSAGPLRRHDLPNNTPTDGGEYIRSELVHCERCNAGAALIVHADNATDEAGIEDYARKMYSKVANMDLPTWVIGPQLGDGDPETLRAYVLKLWPERQPAQKLTPPEVRAQIDPVVDRHCR